MGTSDIDSTRGFAEFITSVADDMGLGDAVHVPGTTVVASDERAGSSMVVAYSISQHTVLWCDPAIAPDLAELADTKASKSQEEISAWVQKVGWEVVSYARMQLLRESGVARSAMPAAIATRTLDRERVEDVALVEAFKGTLSDGDRDEADLDEDRLDAHMLAVVDERGIAAFASQQPFFYADRFGDIAIATRPDARGLGLGRIAVTVLCDEIEDRGLFPLYRCDEANVGSVRLSASMGFVPVVKVLACRRP